MITWSSEFLPVENNEGDSAYILPVPGRISPSGKAKNVFGPQLKKMRLERDLSATEVIAQLNVLGWDVANSSYSQLEAGDRILGDLELLLILKVLKTEFRDLKPPARIFSR